MERLPNDLIMKEMAKIAIEQATQMFAEKAMELSRQIPEAMTGQEALVAFARSIRETNSEVFGKGTGRS